MKCATCKHCTQIPGTMGMIDHCEKGHWRSDFKNRIPDTSQYKNCTDYESQFEELDQWIAQIPIAAPPFPPPTATKKLTGWWGKLEDPFTGMPGYDPDKPQPEFLQEAVNLNIELSAAIREIEQLKTFLFSRDLLETYQRWKAQQETNQNEVEQ